MEEIISSCGEMCPSRVLFLDRNRVNVLQTGAMLVGTLAFPEPGEEEKRDKAAAALCAGSVRAAILAYPNDANWWRNEYSDYLAIDEKERRRRLRTLRRRLLDRMAAARMASPFFQEAYSGEKFVLPASMERLSLNELSKFMQDRLGDDYAHNLRKRAWYPSLPVIHLAAAFRFVIRKSAPEATEFGYPLDNAELHDWVIRLASFNELIVDADPRFGAARSQMIRFRR